MNIQRVVRHALERGTLLPEERDRMDHALSTRPVFDGDDFLALTELQRAIENGLVDVPEPPVVRNVMEQVVWQEARRRVLESDLSGEQSPILEEVVAYALNRLPPLYATSERGERFQRELADRDLVAMVARRVDEGLAQVHGISQAQGAEASRTGGAAKGIQLLLEQYARLHEKLTDAA